MYAYNAVKISSARHLPPTYHGVFSLVTVKNKEIPCLLTFRSSCLVGGIIKFIKGLPVCVCVCVCVCAYVCVYV